MAARLWLLWNALASLATQVEALAGTAGAVHGQLRQRLDLGATADTAAIDHAPPGQPEQTPGQGGFAHEPPGPTLSGPCRGRGEVANSPQAGRKALTAQ